MALAAGVPVSFIGTVGVREAANALAEKGIINEAIAGAMVDLSAQFQFMYRTTTDKSAFLNEGVATAFAKAAIRIRQSLKAAE